MASAKLNDPARRDEWVRHVEAWRPTGQSMRGYCRDHHLSVGVFRRWVLALENTDSVEAAARQALKRRKKSRGIRLNRSTSSRQASPPPSFLEGEGLIAADGARKPGPPIQPAHALARVGVD